MKVTLKTITPDAELNIVEIAVELIALREGILDVSEDGLITLPSGKQTKGYDDVYGYRYITPKIKGKKRNIKVHRLVATKYISNPESKPCINHIDGDKTNNHVSNLEWCTYSENMKHAFKKGLLNKTTLFKEGEGRKHSDSDLSWIRDLYLTKRFTMNQLAQLFNTSSSYISIVVNLQYRP